jgi:hypothetical protein
MKGELFVVNLPFILFFSIPLKSESESFPNPSASAEFQQGYKSD